MRILILLIVLFPLSGLAQKNIPRDTTLGIMGMTKRDCYLMFDDNSCTLTSVLINKYTKVFIYNISECLHEKGSFYEVYYHSKVYKLDTVDVATAHKVYDSISAMSAGQRQRLIDKAWYADSLSREIDLVAAANEITRAKSYGIIIKSYGLYDVSEYTDGTGINFEVYNTGTKTIKYIWFNVTAFNSVNDKVYSSKYRSYVATLQGVGPIAPRECGAYNWDYVWFNDLPQSSKIISVKLQFMDGTVKTITDTKKIILSQWAVDLLSEDK